MVPPPTVLMTGGVVIAAVWSLTICAKFVIRVPTGTPFTVTRKVRIVGTPTARLPMFQVRFGARLSSLPTPLMEPGT